MSRAKTFVRFRRLTRMPGRLERALTLAILLVTACTVLPAARTPAHVATRRVAIPGEEADTLGETSTEGEGALVPVHTHDGRELWVHEASLGGAAIVPGTWVLVRQNGALVTAPVTRSLDDFVEVELAGAPVILAIGDVLARLHHGPPVAHTDPPVVTPPVLPPPTPLGQMVLLDAAPRARTARLETCAGDRAHVTYPDGTATDVPTSALHPLRVRAGDHVTALWSGTPYPAIILATRDSLVRARWEDGTEQWVELTDVQAVEGAVSGAVHGCPHHAVLVDEGVRTRIGRVLACEADHATVLDAAGTPRSLAREALVRVPLRVGDAIEASWNGTPYEAIVLSIGERIHVRWSDTTENDVDPADLLTFRVLEERAAEPASCP
jgi:hypothetical protein